MKPAKELTILSDLSTITIKNFSDEMMFTFMPALDQLLDHAETHKPPSTLANSYIGAASVLKESRSVIKLSQSETAVKQEKQTFTVKECPIEMILDKPLDESSMVNLLRLVGEHSPNSLSLQNAQILSDILVRSQSVDVIKLQRTGVRIICRIPEQTFRPLYRLPVLVQNFTGRENELADLSAHRGKLQVITEIDNRDTEESYQKEIVSQISGTGGIGKSQLANYFAQFHFKQKYYNWVIWITGGQDEVSTRNNVLSQLVELGIALGLDPKELSEKVLHQLIYERLAKKGRGLLVIDDVPDYIAVQTYLPENFGQRDCEVLITTRNSRNFGPAINKIILDVFTLKDAKDYIMRTVKYANDVEAQLLATTLDRYPLALTQALAYISDAGCKIEQYCREYNELVEAKRAYLKAPVFQNDPYTADQRRRDERFEATMLTVVEMSLKRLRELCRDDAEFQVTHEVLKGASYLSPQVAIPKAILCGWIVTPENIKVQNLLINSALEKLRTLSLLEDSEHRETYQMHQVVQDIIKIDDSNSLNEQRTIKWCGVFLGYINSIDLNSLIGEKVLSELFPHAEQLRQGIEKLEQNEDLLWTASHFLQIMGRATQKNRDDKSAKRYFADELQCLLRCKNQEKGIMICRVHLASTMLVSNPTEARIQLEKALPVLIKLCGEISEEVGLCMSHLGYALKSCGKTKEAIRYLEQSLKIFRSISPQDHASIDACQLNYGVTILHDNPHKAKLQLDEVLPRIRKAFGEQHIKTALLLMNLGAACSASGDPKRGIEELKQALEILLNKLGEHHLEVGLCRQFLGNSYTVIQDRQNARIELEKAYIILSISLGQQSERVADCRISLGNALLECSMHLDDETEILKLASIARKHFVLALSVLKKSTGEQSHNVGLCLFGLGKAMATCQEEPHITMENARNALVILRQALGNSHPDVGRCLKFIGLLTSKAGALYVVPGPKRICALYLREAWSSLEEAVSIFSHFYRAVYPVHPETLDCLTLLEEVRQKLLQAGISYQKPSEQENAFLQRPRQKSILDALDQDMMPISYDAALLIVQHLFGMALFKPALIIVEMLINIDAENADAHLVKSNCLTLLHEFDLAETHLKIALSLDPDIDDDRTYINAINKSRESYNNSRAIVQQLNSRKELPPREKIELVINLRAIREVAEALEVLNDLERQLLEPVLFEHVYYQSAWCHFLNNDLKNALRYIEYSLEINRRPEVVNLESMIVISLQAEEKVTWLLSVLEISAPETSPTARPK